MPQDEAQGNIARLVESIEEDELRRWVEVFSGLRHGRHNQAALEKKGELLERHFRESGFLISRDHFHRRGEGYHNIVVTLPGKDLTLTPYLVGAHYDAFPDSCGADDNASGVAALLAAARALGRIQPERTVRFVGFNLEEPQDARDSRCRHGSRHFARKAFFRWDRYEGVFILESVGYTDSRPGSQKIPGRLPIPVPDVGDFLGVVGNRRSRRIMGHFGGAAHTYVQDLRVISHWFPLAGRLLPMTRMSDHAPFWDYAYPAVMLTDTAFLRNPNYHQPTDTPDTLDYTFLANVTRALAAALALG